MHEFERPQAEQDVRQRLGEGGRGLPGGSSLAKLLAEQRGVRNRMDLSTLTVDQILAWVDEHYRRIGAWPRVKSGPISGTNEETWGGIEQALKTGRRGLSGGSSLAKLLADNRGVRNPKDLPDVTIEQILAWAERHYERTGEWPTQYSGAIDQVPGESWPGINSALNRGRRGLPGGSSLAKLLAKHRRHR